MVLVQEENRVTLADKTTAIDSIEAAAKILLKDRSDLRKAVITELGGRDAELGRELTKLLSGKTIVFEADVENSPFIAGTILPTHYQQHIRQRFIEDGLPIPRVFIGKKDGDISNIYKILWEDGCLVDGVPKTPVLLSLDTCSIETLERFLRVTDRVYPMGLPTGYFLLVNTSPLRNPGGENSLASRIIGQKFKEEGSAIFPARKVGGLRKLTLFSSSFHPSSLQKSYNFYSSNKGGRERIVIAKTREIANALLQDKVNSNWFFNSPE